MVGSRGEDFLFKNGINQEEEAEDPPLLRGEKIQFRMMEGVSIQLSDANQWRNGSLFLSNYQLFFRNESFPSQLILIPFMLIESLKRKAITTESHEMKLKLKDLRQLRIKIQGKEVDKIHNTLSSYLQINSVDPKLFAFHFKMHISKQYEGWNVYDCINEYQRMNIPNADWKISSINAEYLLCATYPRLICVPSSIKGGELMCVSAYRSGGRIPVLVWKEPLGNACLMRCSQPLTGLTGNRCPEDERILSLALNASGSNQIHIVDCRPYKNAVANQMKGGGYENVINYGNTSISWAGMANIHGVYDSWTRLFLLINRKHSSNSQSGWFGALEASGWMNHIYQTLETTVGIVDHISLGHSVVIHCTDGWDRTPTVLSLAQICLDPYYRTLDGIMVLIEKDWVSFGHRFGERCGRQPSTSNNKKGLSSNSDSKVVSSSKAYGFTPIFLLFVDCIHQIMEQFPLHFEYNEQFLIRLMDSVYSCQYGTFLTNCEKEQVSIQSSTVSFWTSVNANRQPFLNPLYFKLHSKFFQSQKEKLIPETTRYEKKSTLIGSERLLIDSSSKYIRFWSAYYLRGWNESDSQLIVPSIDTQFSVKKQKSMPNLKSNQLSSKKTFIQLAHSVIDEKDIIIRSLMEKISDLEVQLGPRGYIKEIINSIIDKIVESKTKQLPHRVLEIDTEEDNLLLSTKWKRESKLSASDNTFRLSKPPEWVPDQIALCCKICLLEFTSFRRKHHCRNCGCVFCSNCCSNKRLIERLGFVRPVRVCNNCVEHIDRQVSPANSPSTRLSSFQ